MNFLGIRGADNGRTARVSDEGQLEVVVHPHPPRNEGDTGQPIPFRQYLTDDGAATGSNDMLVDGSSTNVPFWIGAQSDKDIYIKMVSFVIADATGVLNEFGNLNAALTNGCKFQWVTQDLGTTVLSDTLTTNWEFVRMCGGEPAVGGGNSIFRPPNIIGSSEGFVPFLDFSRMYAMPWGVRLRKGTNDRLELIVRDNVSTVDAFDAIGTGFKF
jgi:hypothetical protein